MAGPEECTSEEFSAAVGDTVIAWQKVEASSAHFFAHLLASRSSFGAIGCFYHVNNFSTRLDLMGIAAPSAPALNGDTLGIPAP